MKRRVWDKNEEDGIHSFIHSGEVDSAPSRSVLRSTDSQRRREEKELGDLRCEREKRQTVRGDRERQTDRHKTYKEREIER